MDALLEYERQVGPQPYPRQAVDSGRDTGPEWVAFLNRRRKFIGWLATQLPAVDRAVAAAEGRDLPHGTIQAIRLGCAIVESGIPNLGLQGEAVLTIPYRDQERERLRDKGECSDCCEAAIVDGVCKRTLLACPKHGHTEHEA